jgi:hypothetical protein
LLHNFGEWLESLGFARVLGTTAWLYASISVVHYFTLFILVGTSVLVDLRVLGLAGKRKPVTQFAEQIYPWMWTAFWLAIISGFLMVVSDAGDFFPDRIFKIKIIMIVVAVILVIIIQRSIPKWGQLSSIPIGAKVLAFFSLFSWLGAVLAAVDIASISGLG